MPRTTAQKKVVRDQQIVHDRMRGHTWPRIASTYKLSERQCRTIVAEHRRSRVDLDEIDPIERAREYVERHELILEKLADLYDEARQDAVRLGVIKAQLAALQTKLVAEQAVGLVPALRLLSPEVRWQTTVDRAMKFLDGLTISDDERRELAAVVDPVRTWKGRRNGSKAGS
jgi:hypothetical protein